MTFSRKPAMRELMLLAAANYAVAFHSSSSTVPFSPAVHVPPIVPVMLVEEATRPRKRDMVLDTFKGFKGVVRLTRPKQDWPMLGGTNKYHSMSGPWPAPPPRELWVPPPGWEPPSRPVSASMTEEISSVSTPAVASRQWSKMLPDLAILFQLNNDWPMLGGTNKYHPMSGPWPAPPPRELWVPPPGWEPPSKAAPMAKPAAEPVVSWYDAGRRLAAASDAATEVEAVTDDETVTDDEAVPAERFRKRDRLLLFVRSALRILRPKKNAKLAALKAEGEAVVARRLEIAQLMAALKPAAADEADSAVVVSWYDSGLRLAAPAEPAADGAKIAALKAEGEAVVARRLEIAQLMAAPKFAAAGEASGALVVSWYDSGLRLAVEPAARRKPMAAMAAMAAIPKALELLREVFKPSGTGAEPVAEPVAEPEAPKAAGKREAVKAAIGRVAKAATVRPSPVFGPPPPGFEWGLLFSDEVDLTPVAATPVVDEEAELPAAPTEAVVKATTPSPPLPAAKKTGRVPIRKADLQLGLPPAGFYWGGVY